MATTTPASVAAELEAEGPRIDRSAATRAWTDASRAVAAALACAGVLASQAGPLAVRAAASVLLALVAAALLVVGWRRPAALVPSRVRLGSDLALLVIGQWALAGPDRGETLVVAVLAPLPLVSATAYERGRVAGRAAVVAALAVHGVALLAAWLDDMPVPGASALLGALALAGIGAWAVEAAATARDQAAALAAEEVRGVAFRRTIVTTVSHELRTPLTIIQGLTSTLTSRWADLPETRRLDVIDLLAINVASLDASILHFLDAGRLEKGEWEVRRTEAEVAPLVDAMLAKLEPVLAGRRVSTRVDAERALVDGEALQRIVELLLVNACRFSEPGTDVSVRITPGERGGVDVAVADQGRGIPPRDLPHVFEPLWRSDVQDSGVSRGAGLGLSIVKGLAELHGGDATVASPRGRGTTFRVRLPGA